MIDTSTIEQHFAVIAIRHFDNEGDVGCELDFATEAEASFAHDFAIREGKYVHARSGATVLLWEN